MAIAFLSFLSKALRQIRCFIFLWKMFAYYRSTAYLVVSRLLVRKQARSSSRNQKMYSLLYLMVEEGRHSTFSQIT